MIIVSLVKVSLLLGSRLIINDLSWEIQDGHKIGLIGPNGVGKSSLLKLITGELYPEPGGSIVLAKGVTIGYLPQQIDFSPELTAFDIAFSGNYRIHELRAELNHIETRLRTEEVYNNPKELASTLDRQNKLGEEYHNLGGDNYENHVRETLIELGFLEDDILKPVYTLSCGQKKLVGLARLLLQRPSLLLLDEPDKHLDLAGKEYLEKFIGGYQGAVVIVSHDRYLLDGVVTHIAEISDGKITQFRGDYSSYIVDKEEKLTRQYEIYNIQQREIARLEAAIKRYALWAKLYSNEKFANRARAIQGRLDRIDRIERTKIDVRKVDINNIGWRGSTKVLELVQVEKYIGSNRILNNINLIIRHGERVGLIGANGTGKTVLFKIISGLDIPDSGEIVLGPSVKLGYYSQQGESLAGDQTLLDAVRYKGELSESDAIALLIHYLFSYKQVYQKVKELSGGELSRLQLALLMLSEPNFLLLDEPTNNLDIPSAEVLENVLSDFIGTVLVISHDRYFLDRTVEQVIELQDGNFEVYPGCYSDYALRKALKIPHITKN